MLRAGSAMGILGEGRSRGTVRRPFDSSDQSFRPSGLKFHPRARTRAWVVRTNRVQIVALRAGLAPPAGAGISGPSCRHPTKLAYRLVRHPPGTAQWPAFDQFSFAAGAGEAVVELVAQLDEA